MTDLKSKNWDHIAAGVEFNPEIMKPHYNVAVFITTDSDFHLGKKTVKVCIRCKEMFPLEPCSNCGSDQYVPGLTTQRVAGLFCHKCEKGFSSWECPNCQTSNPINKSLATEKSGCFIATEVYGSYSAPEVMILRAFRDKVLSRSILGDYFIRSYYFISPHIAKLISKKESLKLLLKKYVFNHLLNHIKE
jgi:RNA polymerase subunit RPABC4/transcription elongation factor Spt4